MKTSRPVLAAIIVLAAAITPASAMYSVGYLTKEKARQLGVTMKHRPNGDAGVMVWIEFKKEGVLKAFTYAELRVTDPAGKHLLSARLQPNPVVHDQSRDITSVSFSATPEQLQHCAFMIVAYGSSEGDVGYIAKVKDFLELEKITR